MWLKTERLAGQELAKDGSPAEGAEDGEPSRHRRGEPYPVLANSGSKATQRELPAPEEAAVTHQHPPRWPRSTPKYENSRAQSPSPAQGRSASRETGCCQRGHTCQLRLVRLSSVCGAYHSASLTPTSFSLATSLKALPLEVLTHISLALS